MYVCGNFSTNMSIFQQTKLCERGNIPLVVFGENLTNICQSKIIIIWELKIGFANWWWSELSLDLLTSHYWRWYSQIETFVWQGRFSIFAPFSLDFFWGKNVDIFYVPLSYWKIPRCHPSRWPQSCLGIF